jgi:hypothetical protein
VSDESIPDKQPPARKKAAAAKAEKENKPKTVEFQGITLELPAKLPAAVAFEIADVEENGEGIGSIRILKSMIGLENYKRVKARVYDAGEADLDVALGDLIEEVAGLFGLKPGE